MRIIGEEAACEGRAPENFDRNGYFWIIDPLDGTKEFIGGGGDYTVNIALVYKNEPVLGVVYAPSKGEMYAGHAPGTAIKWNEDTDKEKPISVRENPAARSHDRGKQEPRRSEKAGQFFAKFQN